jgi:hypothetical protein
VSQTIRISPELVRQVRERAAPNLPREVVEKALRRCFTGKRRARRTVRLLDVEVKGRRRSFPALAVDLSRSGALLRIMDPRFARHEEQASLMPYTARVWYHFQGGFKICFGGGDICLEADVVRVSGYCGQDAGLIFIGCRFRSPLDEPQCQALGVDPGGGD